MEDRKMLRLTVRSVVLVSIMVAVALPAVAQSKVAVIDVQRVVTESDPGKEVMQKLRVLSDTRPRRDRTFSKRWRPSRISSINNDSPYLNSVKPR
jgi:hypothetical protein